MYLGIDGGGTKTAFALLHADGSLLARHDSGSAYYLEAGLDGVAAMLRQGAAETLALAGVTADAVRYAFFGLPAYGEDSALTPSASSPAPARSPTASMTAAKPAPAAGENCSATRVRPTGSRARD